MSPTILLVEDDANDVYFMKHAVHEAGIANPLQVAQDGQEAMDYLGGLGPFADRQRFPLPSLVLLDLKLPRVMGFEVLKWIRQQPALKSIIVIILTSSEEEPDVDLAYRLGANSYLVKPSRPDKLTKLITTVKQYWLDLNRHAPQRMAPTEEAKQAIATSLQLQEAPCAMESSTR
jgi:CheY-like chemotaxis protein